MSRFFSDLLPDQVKLYEAAKSAEEEADKVLQDARRWRGQVRNKIRQEIAEAFPYPEGLKAQVGAEFERAGGWSYGMQRLGRRGRYRIVSVYTDVSLKEWGLKEGELPQAEVTFMVQAYLIKANGELGQTGGSVEASAVEPLIDAKQEPLETGIEIVVGGVTVRELS